MYKHSRGDYSHGKQSSAVRLSFHPAPAPLLTHRCTTRRIRMESLLTKVRQGLSSLQGSPRELYKAYILKFLDSYSYFSLSIIFTLFLK